MTASQNSFFYVGHHSKRWMSDFLSREKKENTVSFNFRPIFLTWWINQEYFQVFFPSFLSRRCHLKMVSTSRVKMFQQLGQTNLCRSLWKNTILFSFTRCKKFGLTKFEVNFHPTENTLKCSGKGEALLDVADSWRGFTKVCQIHCVSSTGQFRFAKPVS